MQVMMTAPKNSHKPTGFLCRQSKPQKQRQDILFCCQRHIFNRRHIINEVMPLKYQ